MLTALVIYHVVSASSFYNNTVIFYYIVGIAAILVGAVLGGYKIYTRQRARWTNEGVQRAKSAQVMEENNKQLLDNTAAIAHLSTQLADFTLQVTNTLNGHGKRIERLERYRPHPREKAEDD
jgi:hypothetical protein